MNTRWRFENVEPLAIGESLRPGLSRSAKPLLSTT